LEQSISLLSYIAWKQRLVFWIGAIIVGLVIVMMTLLSEWAAQTYRILSLHLPIKKAAPEYPARLDKVLSKAVVIVAWVNEEPK